MFCKLTWRHLNKEPHHIMRHIEGKRFKRAYILCKSSDIFEILLNDVFFIQGQECQANGTEYVPVGKRKKKQKMTTDDDDDDQYVDLTDEEDDEDEDLTDLYPGLFACLNHFVIDNSFLFSFLDFRRLRTSDSGAGTAGESPEEEDTTSGTKRKAQTSQVNYY